MPDALTTITKLINSPPGQLAAGGVLAGIVWKFFERVEAVLTDQTRVEIAVWLVGVEAGKKVQPWPETFAKVFDRVFGKKHLSWRSFFCSAIASLFLFGLTFLVIWGSVPTPGRFMILGFFGSVVPNYLSLLETRYSLRLMKRTS